MTTQEMTVKQSMDSFGMAVIDFKKEIGVLWWIQLQTAMMEFKSSESFAEQKAKFLSTPAAKGDKSFLIRLRPEEGSIWLAMAEHPKLVQFARDYFLGNQPVLADCDVWHTEPMPDDRERIMSQDWHIDAEAQRFPRRIFKAFLYFNDIKEGNGPLEVWVTGSSYQKNEPVKMCVPAGAMVLADTGALLHRGGYCQTGHRTLALWYYTNSEAMTVPPLLYGKPVAA